MRAAQKLRLRFRSLLRREIVEHELADELQFHLDQLTEEKIAAGMAPEDARTAALRSLGSVAQYQEECRDMRQMNIIEDSWRDLRHAARVLQRSPGFTLVAVLTLALGIGATAAIFSVVYGVLLKPLPFSDPERLVGLYHRGPGVNLALMNQGPTTYFTYLDNQRSFEGMGVWDRQEVSITGGGEPERVEALAVTHGTLPLLRVQPVLGRLFNKEDDRPGSPMRVVLTYGYWQRKFGGAQDVIGRLLEIDGASAEVTGVLPPSFKFLRNRPAVLLPLQPNRADANSVSFGFQGLARLKPGVILSEANADIARMIPLVEQVPGFKAFRLEPNVRPLAHDVIGNVGRFLWILLGAVGMVLLIACANVANLFLVRAEGRQQELAVRAALGAGRGRIARELLAESLMLGLAGGAAGLLFARTAIELLRKLAPATLPRVDEISIDPVVLVFTVLISLFTGLLFGLIPVLKFGTVNAAALKEGGRGASDGPVRQRTRNTLVVAEVAMALVLLIISGLMIRTFVAMQQVNPGFARPEAVQTFRVEVPDALVEDELQMARTHDQIAQRLRQVPGVVSVGLSSSITMDGEDNGNPLGVEHVDVPEGQMPPMRRFKSVAPGYFDAMGNPLAAGRDITWTEIYQRRRVVIISEILAREYWGSGSNALGKRVRGLRSNWYEVVGVAGSERDDGLNRPATAIVYWPLLNEVYETRSMAYAVRSSRVGSSGFLRELQQAVWSVNPQLPLANVLTLKEIHADSLAQTSFAMVMLAIAASVALLLGVVGIYGVIAYIATQRTREIGIRIALGAQTADVSRLFVRHGLLLTGAGIAIGIVISLALTGVMSTLLFGVSPVDPATYAAVSVSLACVALLATWLPARRLSRADPVAALRSGT
ncbi:MAG TPA: ABC transporter permease [Bryobacteraceae bacterium]|nr:ABC transporter permease [Bryobacteraceae bacterium]